MNASDPQFRQVQDAKREPSPWEVHVAPANVNLTNGTSTGGGAKKSDAVTLGRTTGGVYGMWALVGLVTAFVL